ncbi:hypothetical protein D1646_03805 [Pseudoflavonifractor sp. 60]|uniref:hypothetical protein n=1 Tax=Pseudoflavonifractor sp. 60 TaxID=2304576 RepID=UPI00136E0420|nr:hypothetical protein [Pseudoflavonifractor sp. 60]NBI65949.1 hypothetical protein [Pseudoflavonifractor sp. 60]
MPRYFMSDTRLGWLEKMMMTPPKPAPSRTPSRQKGPQKKLPCSRPAKPNSREWEIKGDCV